MAPHRMKVLAVVVLIAVWPAALRAEAPPPAKPAALPPGESPAPARWHDQWATARGEAEEWYAHDEEGQTDDRWWRHAETAVQGRAGSRVDRGH